ncbi:putative adhesin [Actinokineospora diospyrosa]|uniref:Putative adhesin Stv domain-containing protein n=1 Tax=Actinokineospora diospyrosa TaxID=103728 RepID=A0ABT1INQ9_9PSEU|nr:hypothetical protein [Actinokineospora diospyrosa]MCP2274174.1 hypothetical protein [Actinokineospora diospyrosa]
MAGVIMGHGSHVGDDVVTVPAGLPVHFFTDEGSPLLMVNLLELIKRDNPRTPMHTAKPGVAVLNYQYAPFQPHELRAIAQADQLDLPHVVVGTEAQRTALRLCEDPKGCPAQGPHRCAGVFGRAAAGGWSALLVVSCRILTGHTQPPTVALMTPSGKRDTSVFDALFAWVSGFVPQAPAAQDTTWAALSAAERIRLIASDDEIRLWADCLDLRTRIAAVARPAALALVKAAPVLVRFRLLRDYPAHRDLVRDGTTLSPVELKAIADFPKAPFDDQVREWLDLDLEDAVRWMADPVMTSWATAFNALEMFDAGLRGPGLLAMLGRLDPAGKAFAQGEPALVEYLTRNSLRI